MVTLFQQGFRYVEKEGQCCSQCQQVACVANFPFGTVTIEVSAALLCMPAELTSVLFEVVSYILRLGRPLGD